MPPTPSPRRDLNQTLTIPLGDRWQVMRRLHELEISAACPSDGSLRVDIHCPLALILVRSTVQQFTTPREELVQWLDRCWQVTTAGKVGC